jgi:hypothetical protein
MNKSNFFIIGAPKCGTTAFAQILSTHPNICISEPKEPHYFDVDYPENQDIYVDNYFSSAHDGQLLGEATPSYLMLPYVPWRIRDYNCDSKIIVLLRNPVERAFSSWWMLYSRRMETLHFLDALKAELDQGDIFGADNLKDNWQNQVRAIRSGDELPIRTYLESGYYAKHLKRYFEIFPRANIKVIFSSDLRSSPVQTVKSTLDFLGLERSSEVKFSVQSNRAVGVRATTIIHMLKVLGLMKLRHVFPGHIRNYLKLILSDMGEVPVLSEEQRAVVGKYFIGPNKELSDLLSVELPF